MKKIIAYMLVFSLLLICGCTKNTPTDPSRSDPVNSEQLTNSGTGEQTTEKPVLNNSDMFIPASIVTRTDWTENEYIYNKCINTELVKSDSKNNCPIFKFDNVEDLEKFKNETKSYLNWYYFDETNADRYNEKFFKDNFVLLVYKTAPSGSFRYGIKGVSVNDSDLTVYIERKDDTEVGTTDMAGWFIFVMLNKTQYANCKNFNAEFLKT